MLMSPALPSSSRRVPNEAAMKLKSRPTTPAVGEEQRVGHGRDRSRVVEAVVKFEISGRMIAADDQAL